MSALSLAPYRAVLARGPLRRILLLGIVVRIPIFATAVMVTIHVVTTLGRSYAEAGLVAAAATIAVAVSGPMRGRLLDRYGLRPVVGPMTLVSGVCWAVAPWVGYWALLALVVVAGVTMVPMLSIIRQTIIAASQPEHRRTAISLDTSFVELSFIISPALALAATSVWGSAVVLFAVQMLGVVAGLGVWLLDPRLRSVDEAAHGRSAIPWQEWIRAPFVVVCGITAAAAVVLSGTDLSIIAAVRDLGGVAQVGLLLAVWAAGSLVGGLVYGAASQEVPAAWLLVGLAVTTVPMAFASSAWTLAAGAFVAGLLCAPTISSTIDEISRVVPAERRGEAMGWHSGALTLGGAVGAPFAGMAIDGYGAGAGFVAVAVVGAVAGVLTMVVPRAAARAVTESEASQYAP